MVKTTDLGCAAAIVCLGHEMTSITKDPRYDRRVVFEFEEEARADIDLYVLGGLMVDPLKYHNTVRSLRGRAYDLHHQGVEV